MVFSRLGGYFAIEPAPVGDHWRPQHDLVDSGFVARRMNHRREAMSMVAGSELTRRAAASIASVSLFVRLVSPTVGALATDSKAPRSLWWQDILDGEIPLAADGWEHIGIDEMIEELIEPVAHHLHEEFGVSMHTLGGNVASAVFSALAMVQRHSHVSVLTVERISHDALAHPLLASTAVASSARFRRRSCCQMWAWRHDYLCSDCVLNRPPTAAR